jgi:hypothetical protein
MKYCCRKLKHEVEQINGNSIFQKRMFVYDKKLRCFGVSPNGTTEIYQPMEYCPFCGSKFESALITEYWETIKMEYGTDKRLPPEFQTDEWWKKRGL